MIFAASGALADGFSAPSWSSQSPQLSVLIPLDPLDRRIPEHADDTLGDILADLLWQGEFLAQPVHGGEVPCQRALHLIEVDGRHAGNDLNRVAQAAVSDRHIGAT